MLTQIGVAHQELGTTYQNATQTLGKTLPVDEGPSGAAHYFITQQQLKEFSDYRATGEYVDYTYAPR